MAFNVEKAGDVTVIEVEGQLIVGNRQELKQRVLDELDGGERQFADSRRQLKSLLLPPPNAASFSALDLE